MTTQAADRRAILARLGGAQKSNRGAAGYSRWVNRRLGRQIAAAAYLAGLTPNQVSVISAALTFPALAVLAAAEPTPLVTTSAVLALLLGYAFDSADGQVARLRGGGSPSGEWLDHVLDAVKMASVHLVVAVAWFRWYDVSEATLLLPLGFAVVSCTFFFAQVLVDMLRRIADARAGGTGATTASVDPGERAPVLRSLLVLPNDYGVLCLSFLLLPAQGVFVAVYALLFAANAAFLVAGCARWFRELRGLGRGLSASPRSGR